MSDKRTLICVKRRFPGVFSNEPQNKSDTSLHEQSPSDFGPEAGLRHSGFECPSETSHVFRLWNASMYLLEQRPGLRVSRLSHAS